MGVIVTLLRHHSVMLMDVKFSGNESSGNFLSQYTFSGLEKQIFSFLLLNVHMGRLPETLFLFSFLKFGVYGILTSWLPSRLAKCKVESKVNLFLGLFF